MLSTLADTVVHFGLNWLIQSSLVLLPAYAVLVALRRLGPHFEALACRWILVGAMLTPLVTLSMQAIGMRGWPVNTQTAGATPTVSQSRPVLNSQLAQTNTLPVLPTNNVDKSKVEVSQRRTTDSLPKRAWLDLWPAVFPLLSLSWFIVSAIFFVRLLRADSLVHRIRRSANLDSEVQTHCQRLAHSLQVRCPAVLRTDRVDGPCLVGVIRPAILIPMASADSRGTMAQVLIHELAHVQRHDVLWNGLFRIGVALLPFQPLLWWLQRRHEMAAEKASDDLVVQHVDEPASYAQMLLRLATSRHTQSHVAVGMIARTSILSQRVHRILDVRCQHGLTTSLLVKLLLILTVMLQCAVVSWSWLPAVISQAATQRERGHATFPNEWIVSGEVIGIDGQPAIKANVVFATNNYWNFQQTLTTDVQGKFTLRLGDDQAGISDLNILARSADQQTLIYDSVQRPSKGEASRPIALKLERARSIEVHVVDRGNQPVAGARAAVQIVGSYQTSSTNSQGIAKFSMPERQHIENVAAWKDEVGFDFVSYRQPTNGPVGPVPAVEFPTSGVQQIKLTGAKKVVIFVTDVDGQPIPNVSFRVGQFQNPNSQSFATSMLEALSQEQLAKPTDANGRTEFNCIPTWHEGELGFWSESREYERKQVNHPIWSDEPVRMKLERMVTIGGRVTQTNGQPAKGAKVRAIGDAYNISHNEATAFTDFDGRYMLSVPPRHVYLVGVDGDALAAAMQTIVLDSGQSAADVDFQLKTPHRITGRVIDKDDKEPLVECWVFARQYGPKDRSANTALPKEFADKPWNGPYINYSTQADAWGRYEFLLGDGDFEIFTESPRSPPVEFRSHADLTLKDIEVDAGNEFSGLVVQASDGSAVAKARIEAWTLGLELWEAETDAAGKFKVRRPNAQTAIRALSPDGKYGAFEVVTSETKFAFNLQRLGQATGRLVDAKGEPLPKRAIGYSIRMTIKHPKINPAFAPYAYFFGSAVYTDDKGQFKLSQLVPDQEYQLSYYADTAVAGSTELTKIKIAPNESLDLGDIRLR